MRVIHIVSGAAALVLAATLAGCSAGAPAAETTPTPTATFSAADSLEETCAGASAVLSDIQSADAGLSRGIIDEMIWAKHMADGKSKMITLAAAENPGAEALIAALAAGVASIPDTAPQADTFAGTVATEQTSQSLNEVCTANGTELVISMKYGG
jgi:hypothetical protein